MLTMNGNMRLGFAGALVAAAFFWLALAPAIATAQTPGTGPTRASRNASPISRRTSTIRVVQRTRPTPR